MADERKISLNISPKGDADMQWLCRELGITQTETIHLALSQLKWLVEKQQTAKEVTVVVVSQKNVTQKFIIPPVA